MEYLKMLLWLAVVGAIVLYATKLSQRAAVKTGI